MELQHAQSGRENTPVNVTLLSSVQYPLSTTVCFLRGRGYCGAKVAVAGPLFHCGVAVLLWLPGHCLPSTSSQLELGVFIAAIVALRADSNYY